MHLQELFFRFGYEISTRNSRKTVHRFECHHTGKSDPDSRVERGRRKRSATTGKRNCPFVLNLSLPVKRPTVRLTSTHEFRHTCQPRVLLMQGVIVRFRQLSLPMLDKIKEMSDAKKSLATIKRDLISKFQVPLIAGHVIQTAINRIKESNGTKKNQIAALIEWLRSKPEKFTYRTTWIPIEQDGVIMQEVGNVFFVTAEMISLLRHFGEFIVADATYKTNVFGCPFLIFTIHVGTGAFAIAAVALIVSGSKSHLTWAFEQLHEMMGDKAWNRVAVVMTDGDPSYPSIISSLFPHAKHQRCYWHQQRNMRAFCGIAADATECWRLMQNSITSYDELEAELQWKELIDKFFSRDALREHLSASSEPITEEEDNNEWTNRLPDRQRNAVRLVGEWYNIRNTYWKCYTKGLLNFGSIASQSGESMNNVVKERSYVELIDLVQMTERVSCNQSLAQIDESWRSQMRIPIATGLDDWHQVLRQTLTAWAASELTKQLELAQAYNYAMVPDQVQPFLIRVRNTKGQTLTVNINTMTCSCGFIQSRGLLCRHLLATCRGKFAMKKLAEVAVARSIPRWHHKTIESAWGLIQAAQMHVATE